MDLHNLRECIALAIYFVLVHDPAVMIGRVALVKRLRAETRLNIATRYHKRSSAVESSAQSGNNSVVDTIVTSPDGKRSAIAPKDV